MEEPGEGIYTNPCQSNGQGTEHPKFGFGWLFYLMRLADSHITLYFLYNPLLNDLDALVIKIRRRKLTVSIMYTATHHFVEEFEAFIRSV
jgi:hypothetical protein